MPTVQMIAINDRTATIQMDADAPIEIASDHLRECQEQPGPAGYVYRWLMAEFCRCEYDQRQGRSWESPRKTVEEIVSQVSGADAAAKSRAKANKIADIKAAEKLDFQQNREREIKRVAAERAAMETDEKWLPIPSWEVPREVRFDTPRKNSGQIVEVSYGTFGKIEADSSDPYKSITDHGDGTTKTYVRRD